MSINYEIKEQSSVPALTIRTRTPYQDLVTTIQKSYAAIGKHLEKTGAVCSGAPFILYLNEDMNDLDLILGFPAAGNLVEETEVKISEIPAGKVFTFQHVGPYSELAKTYEKLMEYIKTNNIQTSGIVMESYPNDPEVTPPNELITDISFYLKQ